MARPVVSQIYRVDGLNGLRKRNRIYIKLFYALSYSILKMFCSLFKPVIILAWKLVCEHAIHGLFCHPCVFCVCLFSSEPVEEAAQALSDCDQTPDKNKKKNRCFSCRKKVGLTGKYQVLTESRFTSGVTTSCHSESDHRNSWSFRNICGVLSEPKFII